MNGLTWEADPRHAELVVQAFQVTGTRVTTPGAKEKAEDAEKGDLPLDAEDVALYRSVAMRAAYLSMDRPDIQYSCRELAKAMASPTQRHMTALKRLAPEAALGAQLRASGHRLRDRALGGLRPCGVCQDEEIHQRWSADAR